MGGIVSGGIFVPPKNFINLESYLYTCRLCGKILHVSYPYSESWRGIACIDLSRSDGGALTMGVNQLNLRRPTSKGRERNGSEGER